MDCLFDALKLYRSENIGPVSFFYLINMFGSPSKAIENIGFFENKWKRQIKLANNQEIEMEIQQTYQFGAKFLIYNDINFPKQLYNTCPVLTTIGEQQLLQKSMISIVGTRLPSINGLRFCGNLAKELGALDFVIVSGLAKGIDTEAHKNSLNTGTIAVIAGGIDVVYPLENAHHYQSIRENGLIISDRAFGTSPSSKLFPHRNNIIAALGQATIVIESMRDSGALITAKKTQSLGKKVFAVPGHPYDEKYYGNNYLLKRGAVLLTDISDILNHLTDIHDSRENMYYFEGFSPEEQDLIFNLISCAPVKIEDLMRVSGLSIHKILAIITEMEIVGWIKINPDNSVYKIPEP